MTADEILACAHEAVEYGYGTIVMQSGEDYGIKAEWLAEVLRRIKAETELAITLSVGERPDKDLTLWREAGADRYLMRFETSNPALYEMLHPDQKGQLDKRLARLRSLRELGYEVGSGGIDWHSGADLG
jgi:biotin synthase